MLLRPLALSNVDNSQLAQLHLAVNLCILLSLLTLRVRAQVVQAIDNTNSRFQYSPSVCNSTDSGTPDSPSCSGQWQVLAVSGAGGGTVTSTFGPSNATLDIIPQVFLTLRGTSLTLRTSSLSNATAQITLSTSFSNAGTTNVTTTVDTSLASEISAVDLPEDEDLILAVTFVVPSAGEVTRLDIDDVLVWADNSSETSLTPLPTPISSSLPSFITGTLSSPTSTITSTNSSHLAQPVGTIVGETLSIFFGLILIGIGIFILTKRRRGEWSWSGRPSVNGNGSGNANFGGERERTRTGVFAMGRNQRKKKDKNMDMMDMDDRGRSRRWVPRWSGRGRREDYDMRGIETAENRTEADRRGGMFGLGRDYIGSRQPEWGGGGGGGRTYAQWDDAGVHSYSRPGQTDMIGQAI